MEKDTRKGKNTRCSLRSRKNKEGRKERKERKKGSKEKRNMNCENLSCLVEKEEPQVLRAPKLHLSGHGWWQSGRKRGNVAMPWRKTGHHLRPKTNQNKQNKTKV